MRKLIIAIILLVSFFSTSFANSRGYLDQLLNISYGPEIYELNDIKIDNYYFNDSYIKKVYQDYLKLDKNTKSKIIEANYAGKYSYTQITAIIENYKMFNYYLNEFFYNLNRIDKNHSLKENIETQDSIVKSYKNTRIYYRFLNKYITN